MTTLEKLQLAQLAVGNVSENHKAAYTSTLTLREIHADLEPKFLAHLENNGTSQALNPATGIPGLFSFVKSEVARDFLAIKQALAISEASPAFHAARVILDPLLAAVRKLEGQLQDEQTALGLRLNALREAEVAALSKAAATAASDPEVLKIRKQLEQMAV